LSDAGVASRVAGIIWKCNKVPLKSKIFCGKFLTTNFRWPIAWPKGGGKAVTDVVFVGSWNQ